MKILYSLLPAFALSCSLPVYGGTSQLFQPELVKASGEVIRNEDDTAWGGEYASHNKDYHPLFEGSIAGIEGDPVIIWARVRGYAVQIKGVMGDGKQAELAWNWDKPAEWKWLKLGTYRKAELGEKVLLIRGPDAVDQAGLDAVLLTTEPTLDPTLQTQAELQAAIDVKPASR